MQLLEYYGKLMKSTFTVVDNCRVYGYVADSDLEDTTHKFSYIHLGALKTIEDNRKGVDIYHLMEIPGDLFIVYTKDINALFRTMKAENKKVFVKYYESGGYVFLHSLCLEGFLDDDSIPVFSDIGFKNLHQEILNLEPSSSTLPLDENDEFQNLMALKAAQGGGFLHINDRSFYVIANLLNIKKHDSVFMKFYDTYNPQITYVEFIVYSKNKNSVVHTYYKTLQ